VESVSDALDADGRVCMCIVGYQVQLDTMVEVWEPGEPGGYQQELASVTASGLKAILATPWYLNHINNGPDWKNYYTAEPLSFNGICRCVSYFRLTKF